VTAVTPSSRFMRHARFLPLVGLLAIGACITVRTPSFLASAPRREWAEVLDLAQRRAAEGRFDAADSVLAVFASRYAGTREALETSYWRALYKLDPTNRAQSVATALVFLDAYVADDRPRDHASEAVSLRRLVGQVEALAKSGGAVAQKEQTRGGETTATDAEVKRLRDELAKANAELERIRRRLMQPPRD